MGGTPPSLRSIQSGVVAAPVHLSTPPFAHYTMPYAATIIKLYGLYCYWPIGGVPVAHKHPFAAMSGNIASYPRLDLGASGRYADRVSGNELLIVWAPQVCRIVNQRARRDGAAAVQVHSMLPGTGLPIPVAFRSELRDIPRALQRLVARCIWLRRNVLAATG